MSAYARSALLSASWGREGNSTRKRREGGQKAAKPRSVRNNVSLQDNGRSRRNIPPNFSSVRNCAEMNGAGLPSVVHGIPNDQLRASNAAYFQRQPSMIGHNSNTFSSVGGEHCDFNMMSQLTMSQLSSQEYASHSLSQSSSSNPALVGQQLLQPQQQSQIIQRQYRSSTNGDGVPPKKQISSSFSAHYQDTCEDDGSTVMSQPLLSQPNESIQQHRMNQDTAVSRAPLQQNRQQQGPAGSSRTKPTAKKTVPDTPHRKNRPWMSTCMSVLSTPFRRYRPLNRSSGLEERNDKKSRAEARDAKGSVVASNTASGNNEGCGQSQKRALIHQEKGADAPRKQNDSFVEDHCRDKGTKITSDEERDSADSERAAVSMAGKSSFNTKEKAETRDNAVTQGIGVKHAAMEKMLSEMVKRGNEIQKQQDALDQRSNQMEDVMKANEAKVASWNKSIELSLSQDRATMEEQEAKSVRAINKAYQRAEKEIQKSLESQLATSSSRLNESLLRSAARLPEEVRQSIIPSMKEAVNDMVNEAVNGAKQELVEFTKKSQASLMPCIQQSRLHKESMVDNSFAGAENISSVVSQSNERTPMGSSYGKAMDIMDTASWSSDAHTGSQLTACTIVESSLAEHQQAIVSETAPDEFPAVSASDPPSSIGSAQQSKEDTRNNSSYNERKTQVEQRCSRVKTPIVQSTMKQPRTKRSALATKSPRRSKRVKQAKLASIMAQAQNAKDCTSDVTSRDPSDPGTRTPLSSISVPENSQPTSRLNVSTEKTEMVERKSMLAKEAPSSKTSASESSVGKVALVKSALSTSRQKRRRTGSRSVKRDLVIGSFSDDGDFRFGEADLLGSNKGDNAQVTPGADEDDIEAVTTSNSKKRKVLTAIEESPVEVKPKRSIYRRKRRKSSSKFSMFDFLGFAAGTT